MRSARLDRRIEIETFTKSQNRAGEEIEEWTTLCTVWAQVQSESGREFLTSDQLAADVKNVFRIRYRNDLDETMRIQYGGKAWDIRFIKELGRRDGLEIQAIWNSAT